MRIAYFADWELAELEHHGVDLVNVMVRRIRTSGLPLPHTRTIPEGPHFEYEPTKDLFFGRHGRGPLVVVWDTNLLIDYFDHGRALWAGESLPDILPSDQGDQLEALQVIMTLWCCLTSGSAFSGGS